MQKADGGRRPPAIGPFQGEDYPMSDQKFLGLDLSTQSLTALIIDPHDLSLIKHQITFDQDLPHYGTKGGVPKSDDPTTALVNPIMWVEAMEMVLAWVKQSGLAGSIAGISVSAQQHGTVFLNNEAEKTLHMLSPSKALHEQLSGIFSRSMSPIWMDSSTGAECAEITKAMETGPGIMHLTGSHATERFAAPQIRKFWKEDPQAYEATAHIALISSFLTSLLIGAIAPIDGGDGLGMNLVNMHSGNWSASALKATAPGLASKLPPVITRDKLVGPASVYMQKRFGFGPGCQIVVGTGDNPSSLAGLGLVGEEKIRAISLGTSDTYFGYISQLLDQKRNHGHIFGAADGGFMFLLCFKNGSLTREKIRDDYGLDWAGFSDHLTAVRPGNQGRIMLPYLWPEITPLVLDTGIRRYGGLKADDPAANVRAVVEAQIMSMYLHSDWAGKRPDEILITAGGSGNRAILRVIAQVFGARVRAYEVTGSAALGAAVRAAVCWMKADGQKTDFGTLVRDITGTAMSEAIEATPEETRVYQGEDGLIAAYAACEAHFLGHGPDPGEAIARFRRKYA